MSVIKVQENRKVNGEFAVIHRETDAGVVLMANGSTVQDALAGKQDALTFDATPTRDSANPVTSGGVYAALRSAGGKTYLSATEPEGMTAADEWLEEAE